MEQLINEFLQAASEVLASAIVVLTVSLLLYNLSRNLGNRVARTSGVVLACVTPPYVADVFISLGPNAAAMEAALRLQWIGIALMPAALFHLSDALLATTGLPSRGRRRRIIRLLYLLSSFFLLWAALSDDLIRTVNSPVGVSLQAGSWLWVFIIYYIAIAWVTFVNVNRARLRCLTRSAERRMLYLQAAILTPALGIFPFSVWLSPEQTFSLPVSLLIILANGIVVAMLIFLAYPLSFFGSDQPDRVVKVDLLRFLARGPGTALLTLAVIVFSTRGTRILGLENIDFIPFAVVTVVLVWQWFIALALPYAEKWLVYRDEDGDQMSKLQDLSDRMLTRNDMLQLIEATLEASCNYLRVANAFVIGFSQEGMTLVRSVGQQPYSPEQLQAHQQVLSQLTDSVALQARDPRLLSFEGYYLIPLYSPRRQAQSNLLRLIGLFGLSNGTEPSQDSAEMGQMLQRFIRRLEQTLDDLLLQEEIFAALEGLLPQISTTRARADAMEYKPGREIFGEEASDDEESQDEVYEQVRAALRHYWGGPGISQSHLLDWRIVQQRLADHETPVQALRAVLQEAIDKQKPEGERSMTSPQWTIYNILMLRFVEGKKVRDVARRMSLSEPDLFRKQRIAIEALAKTLRTLEQEARQAEHRECLK